MGTIIVKLKTAAAGNAEIMEYRDFAEVWEAYAPASQADEYADCLARFEAKERVYLGERHWVELADSRAVYWGSKLKPRTTELVIDADGFGHLIEGGVK